ncbi:hypothetical protein KXD93_10440 [Mucilaginibacter sp. BJC16-A38]|uniref:hypothetical protein n=1 Tax=Mucilaginibacter phenanthrenivorans TaxID=1234842 RepID=UPI002157A6C2|nr:hypothetical protein [Mucilaginibacter phenanthrenivorans]MCR8558064.1 hypothetical protein [Mucilaginibacter phenanthrenivorans]
MKVYLLTGCVLMLMMLNSAFAQKNLVTNGGFEDELYGWNNNGAQLTPYDFNTGKNSCAIVAANTENWVGVDQTIRVPKKARNIEFSAWLKAVNVVKGKNEWDGAIFTIVFLDVLEKEVGDGVNIARITGDQGWTLLSKKITIPDKAVSFKILIALGNASGTLLADDVMAKEVD